MQFYQQCLGGELSIQDIGTSPLADKMPQQMKDCILHARLTKGAMVLMGTDMVGSAGLIKGNAISIMLNCNSEQELRDCFQKLSYDGTISHPIESTFWGAMLGDLTDKYGNQWLLHFQQHP
jgi:PhnB protein